MSNEAAERQIAEACFAADCSAMQTEAVILHLCDGMKAHEIRHKLHLKRVADARCLVNQALAKLENTPGFWDAAKRFERELLPCAANRDDHDERGPGLRGVEPARASQRFQGAAMVSRSAVRQDRWSAGKMWANNLRDGAVDTASA